MKIKKVFLFVSMFWSCGLYAGQVYVDSTISCKAAMLSVGTLESKPGVKVLDLENSNYEYSGSRTDTLFFYETSSELNKQKEIKSKDRMAKYYQDPSRAVLIEITDKIEIRNLLQALSSEYINIRFIAEERSSFKRNVIPSYDYTGVSIGLLGIAYFNYLDYLMPGIFLHSEVFTALMLGVSAYSLIKIVSHLRSKVEVDLFPRIKTLESKMEASMDTFFHYGNTQKVSFSDIGPITPNIESKKILAILKNSDLKFTFDIVYSKQGENEIMYFGFRRDSI